MNLFHAWCSAILWNIERHWNLHPDVNQRHECFSYEMLSSATVKICAVFCIARSAMLEMLVCNLEEMLPNFSNYITKIVCRQLRGCPIHTINSQCITMGPKFSNYVTKIVCRQLRGCSIHTINSQCITIYNKNVAKRNRFSSWDENCTFPERVVIPWSWRV